MDISRKRINHPRLSLPWIVEYLSRRGLSTDGLLREAEVLSQNEISSRYHMQKKDVGKILRILGFDSQAVRYSKASASKVVAAKAKRESLEAALPTGLSDYVEYYGWKAAGEVFGEKVVADFKKLNPSLVVPHSSVVKSRSLELQVREKKDDIVRLMGEGLSLRSIASSLSLNLNHLKKFALGLDPGYESNKRSEEEKRQTADKIKNSQENLKRLKIEAAQTALTSLDKIQWEKMIVELFENGIIPTDRSLLDNYSFNATIPRGAIQDFLKSSLAIDLEALKPISRIMLAGLKRSPNYSPSPELAGDSYFQSLTVPSFLEPYGDLYRATVSSQDYSFLQSFVNTNKIRNCFELVNVHFPFLHFQSYLDSLPPINFHSYTEEEILELKLNMPLENIRATLEETAPTISNLKELYSRFPNVSTSYIHKALEYFNIQLPPLRVSNPELKVKTILDRIDKNYELHNRAILPGGKEFDFYYPLLRLAIEVNPTHSHNSTYGFQKRLKPLSPSYHLEKSKAALGEGVTLIHLYDEDLEDEIKLESFLQQKITGFSEVYYARSILIEQAKTPLEKSLLRKFIESSHRQGNAPAKLYYGFFDKGKQLVGAASFSPVNAHGADWELKRLCFAPGVQIRFAISKIVNRFSKDNPSAKKLLTYSNIDYGYSDSYQKAGFKLLGETGPSLRWVNPDNPGDSYSWSIATSWSARSGVIAKNLGSRDCSNEEAVRLVEEELPHRSDSQIGYVKLYKAGSRIYVQDL